MKPVANFKKDFDRGREAENKFAAQWGLEIINKKGLPDMRSPTGTLIELKTDFYDPTKTENFFMERYSYDVKPGGVWQAMEAGSEIFVYQFALNGQQFFFHTADLLKWLEENVNPAKLISIMNSRHITRGYKIKRDDVAHLEIKHQYLEKYGLIKKV